MRLVLPSKPQPHLFADLAPLLRASSGSRGQALPHAVRDVGEATLSKRRPAKRCSAKSPEYDRPPGYFAANGSVSDDPRNRAVNNELADR